MPLVVCPVGNVSVQEVKRRGVAFDLWQDRAVALDRGERRLPTDREDREERPRKARGLQELFEIFGD